jgi:hypothetical protein
MLKRTILALSLASIAFMGVVQAQQTATLTLRSGGRLTGQLLDLGGDGFTVKVNGTERQIPAADVAVIDFDGGVMTDAEWAQVLDGHQAIWLRSGEIVNGTLYDVSGSSPLKITVKTASGEREFSSSEISRIVLARPSKAVSADIPRIEPR